MITKHMIYEDAVAELKQLQEALATSRSKHAAKALEVLRTLLRLRDLEQIDNCPPILLVTEAERAQLFATLGLAQEPQIDPDIVAANTASD